MTHEQAQLVVDFLNLLRVLPPRTEHVDALLVELELLTQELLEDEGYVLCYGSPVPGGWYLSPHSLPH